MKNHLLYIGTILCLFLGYLNIIIGLEFIGVACIIVFLLGFVKLCEDLFLYNDEQKNP